MTTDRSGPIRPEFTDEEFWRVLKWAHEGLLVSPTTNPADVALYRRLDGLVFDEEDPNA